MKKKRVYIYSCIFIIVNDDNKHYYYAIVNLLDWKEIEINKLEKCELLQDIQPKKLILDKKIIHIRKNKEKDN